MLHKLLLDFTLSLEFSLIRADLGFAGAACTWTGYR
jgi:hypothetical protein